MLRLKVTVTTYHNIFTGATRNKRRKTVQRFKPEDFILNESVKREVVERMSDKVTVENVATYHQMATTFNMPSFSKATFRCIERFFASVAKTENFPHLSFACVSQILSSSKLNVTSEMEVLRAADRWLSFGAAQRRAFSTDLLVKIRFSLLSNRELDQFLNESLAFQRRETCSSLIDDVLKGKTRNKVVEPRHCDDLDLLVVGGRNLCCISQSQPVQRIDGRNGSVKECADFKLLQYREFWASACVDGCVYVFGGGDAQNVLVKKLPPGGQEWQDLPELDLVAEFFGLCAFMGRIYLIGGWRTDDSGDDSEDWNYWSEARCVSFDAKRHAWEEVGGLRESRTTAGVAVFRGKVVACGGFQDQSLIENRRNLSSVEAYDSAADEWAFMPAMIQQRIDCKLAAIRNKLFVFGGGPATCELFDHVCGQFVLLKLPPVEVDLGRGACAVSVRGSRAVVFLDGCREKAVYDWEARHWSVESCDVTAATFSSYLVVEVPAPFGGKNF